MASVGLWRGRRRLKPHDYCSLGVAFHEVLLVAPARLCLKLLPLLPGLDSFARGGPRDERLAGCADGLLF